MREYALALLVAVAVTYLLTPLAQRAANAAGAMHVAGPGMCTGAYAATRRARPVPDLSLALTILIVVAAAPHE